MDEAETLEYFAERIRDRDQAILAELSNVEWMARTICSPNDMQDNPTDHIGGIAPYWMNFWDSAERTIAAIRSKVLGQ